MRVVFVRHGESEANVAGVVSDDPARPVALTSRGAIQAAAAAAFLRERAFRHAYVSRFLRAQQTAAAILAHHGDCTLLVEARIDERRSGLDGRPIADFHEAVRPDPIRQRPPAGESFVDMVGRLESFLRAAAALHGDATVLAVSHESPIIAACVAAGLPIEEAMRASVPNCGCVELEWPSVGAPLSALPLLTAHL